MLDPQKLLSWPFRDVRCAYSDTDTILYALSIGLGSDPADAKQLPYVYEEGLKAFATMPIVLGMIDDVGFLFDPSVGIDLPRMLHGETGLRLHKPLPPAGEVISRLAIDRLVDRGEGRGAILYFSRTVRDASTNDLLATETGSFFMRGNGGFGGQPGTSVAAHQIPERPCDAGTELATLPQQALLYRLTGDRNPLHADPRIAGKAGFKQPILHGSCTYGFAAHGLAKLLCDCDSHRLRRVDARFTAPVYPGETLQVDVWRTGPGVAGFRVSVLERNLVAIDNGLCEYEERS